MSESITSNKGGSWQDLANARAIRIVELEEMLCEALPYARIEARAYDRGGWARDLRARRAEDSAQRGGPDRPPSAVRPPHGGGPSTDPPQRPDTPPEHELPPNPPLQGGPPRS